MYSVPPSAPPEPPSLPVVWTMPYSQPLRGERRLGWRLVRWGLVLGVWSALVVALGVLWFAWDLPRPEAALDAARRPSLTVQDRAGHVAATFGDMVGEPLRLSSLPAFLPEAAVAVEDRRFWSHYGLDLIGITRAAVVNLTAGRLVQGGSTITQQVAKNLFLTNARTLRRKVQESLLTLWLESHFTKAEILEIWLNRVYLGSGAWGVDAAAKMYFGISARKLNLWQSAVLAGLPRAPSRLSPRVDPAAATARAREVLAAMVDVGDITLAEAQAAAAQIAFPPHPASGYGWFADWAADEGQANLDPGTDAVLHTTMDARLQGVVESRLTALLDGPGAVDGVGQGAVVVLDARTGAVRAMAGGHDYRAGAYNRAVLARRQPGSAFKPFVWLAALEQGARPDDLVLDAPIRIGAWSPSNFDGRFRGEITIESALADSINTAAVRLEQQAGGPRAVATVAARLGITDKLPDNPALALGTAEVGVLELAGAYATFFNGGLRVTPTGLDAIETGGHSTPIDHAEPVRVVAPDTAAMMLRMMAAVVTRGSGRAAAIPGRLVAGKTGTTQDYRDAWFVGGASGQVIAVWLGNDDGSATRGVTGSGLPAKLFHDIAMELRG